MSGVRGPRAWSVPLSLLLVAVALAGCTEEPLEALDVALPLDAIASEDGRDLRTDLTRNDTLPRPDWRVGDWFGHHIFFGSDDAEGMHINVVVTADMGSSWHLISEDEEVARFEAMMDVPIVGDLAKEDLDTSAFGGAWQVYDFPMRDGKTWRGTLTLDDGWAHDLTYTATYRDDFRTEKGTRPGFAVTGVTDQGEVVVETDYVPAVGWYTQFTTWDVTTEDPEDFVFRSISMGVGHDWTGDYVEFEAETLLDTFHIFYPDASTDPPAHAEQFTVPEGATDLAALLFSFAAGGSSDLRLVDPAGQARVQQTTTAPPEGADPNTWQGDGQGDVYFLDATPGAWTVSWAGPAFVAGFGAQVWALTASPGSLPAA